MAFARTPLGKVVLVISVGATGFVGWKIYQNARAAVGHVSTAQQVAVRTEQKLLEQALQDFSLQNMGGPPAGNHPMEFERQFRKMYPRYTGNPANDLSAEGLSLDKLDKVEQLVFWLGGMREKSGSLKLVGFSASIDSPFDRSRPGKPLFDFDTTRLVDADGDQWLEYQTRPVGGKHGIYRLEMDNSTGRASVRVSGVQLDDPAAGR